LRRRYNYKNVKSWSKKVPGKDIFNLKYIFCPINLNKKHWTMAVIFMEDKRIQYYDSFGNTDMAKLEGLLKYVKDEYMAKNGKEMDEMDAMEWKLVSCQMDTPQQKNGELCLSVVCGVGMSAIKHFHFIFFG
jgi:sentrin-specific protease 1